MFEAMYAVMIRMKLIMYSTVGLLSLSLLLSHSVPTKAEMHNMASKGRQMDFTAVANGQTHAQEWDYGCSYCSYEPIMSGFTYSQGTEAGGGKEDPKGFFTTEYYVSVAQATIYSGPGTNYTAMGTLYMNQHILVYTINNGWAKFKVNGVWYYISSSCITKV